MSGYALCAGTPYSSAHTAWAVGSSGTILPTLPTRDGGPATAAMRSSLRLPSTWHLANVHEAILEIMRLTHVAMSEHSVLVKMHLGGSGSIATGDPQPDQERHRSDE